MKQRSQRLARCAMTTALGVVLMLVLGFTGIATYAAPLAVTMMLVPLQRDYGTGTALTVWLATGLLALMLVTDREQSIVYLTIYGWYPAVRPWLERLPKVLAMLVKLLTFNGAVVGTYAVMLSVFGLDGGMESPVLIGILLVMGNATFLMEDLFVIPKAIPVFEERLKQVFHF